MTGPEIKALREARGLTQAALAALAGVSTSALESWEQGRRRPSPEAEARLATILTPRLPKEGG